MKIASTIFAFLFGLSTVAFPQTKPKPAEPVKSVENEKFVFLNNGATVGMIIKSVLKADKQRLKLTDQQLPKAKEIITTAVVKYNEGVKQLKKSGMNQGKLRTLAIAVETDKVRDYKTILTPEQYTILVTQHKKMYPEAKV
ncbi:hypothetical protein [Spirosoma validum]|uniref:Peptidylprolyl isomerase n=1 Tax=Spirosoma validum TaxID=2771355 RepID=A0A927GDI8_9BACT|nr:hypothetical protein [Spirosoma validum]MBD2753847.1 hypothetical protein [Spirosoma validum]